MKLDLVFFFLIIVLMPFIKIFFIWLCYAFLMKVLLNDVSPLSMCSIFPLEKKYIYKNVNESVKMKTFELILFTAKRKCVEVVWGSFCLFKFYEADAATCSNFLDKINWGKNLIVHLFLSLSKTSFYVYFPLNFIYFENLLGYLTHRIETFLYYTIPEEDFACFPLKMFLSTLLANILCKLLIDTLSEPDFINFNNLHVPYRLHRWFASVDLKSFLEYIHCRAKVWNHV